MFEKLESTQLAGNPFSVIFTAVAIILFAFLAGRIIAFLLRKASEKTQSSEKEFLGLSLLILSRISSIIFISIAVHLSLSMLQFPKILVPYIDSLSASIVYLAIASSLYIAVDLVNYWLGLLSSKSKNKMDDMLVPLVRKSMRIIIVVLAAMQIATTFSDEPLTSVIAGLGVGGLAIALAAQETVKNFFGSIVIFSDKPFKLGDRIVVDGFDGPVEAVGFRSTKIRSLEGHLITVPNGELANKTIQNIGDRQNIRQLMNIGVPYDTSPEKVEEAISILKELLDQHEGFHHEFPPRVHFTAFGDFSLNIRVLYWYHPADYWPFAEFHEKLCINILQRFNAADIEFAFPSQTLYLAGDPARPIGTSELKSSN